MIDIQLLHTPLQPQQCINFVTSESAGGIDVFIGTVRNQTGPAILLSGTQRMVIEAAYLLAYGSPEEIEERVCEYCARLGPGGGYVLGSSTSIMEGIPPQNFVAMTRAAHKYGRYGSLGQAS